MKLRSIFFDLYGTLLVYGDMAAAWSAWLTALQTGLEEAGLPIEHAVLAQHCDGFFTLPEADDGDKALTVYERRLLRLCSQLGFEPRRDHLARTAAATATAWQTGIRPDPEAIPTLAELAKRFPLALVSNFDHPPHVAYLLEETGLGAHFDIVVISAAVGVKKPDPRIFSFALEPLGLDAGEVAYVGDAPEDVLGATAAGLHAVHIERREVALSASRTDYRVDVPPANERQPEAGHTIHRLRDVLTLVTDE